jgi:hypothetical protein
LRATNRAAIHIAGTDIWAGVMGKAEEYLQRARECLELVATMNNKSKPLLLKMAQEWLLLAEQAEQAEQAESGQRSN